MSRRSNEERQAHLETLKRLLDLGASTNCVVAYAMGQGLSRAHSYRDALEAQSQRGEEGLRPIQTPTYQMRDTCIRLVCQGLYRAEAANNLDAICKLSKELRSLMALGRIDQGESLTNSIFSSHIEDDPTPQTLHPHNYDGKPLTAKQAGESGDWKGYFDGWTESPDEGGIRGQESSSITQEASQER